MEVGLGLDLTGFYAMADKANQKILEITKNSERLRETIKSIGSDDGGAVLDLLNKMAATLDKVNTQKVSVNIDTSSIDKLVSTVNDVFSSIKQVAQQSADISFFNQDSFSFAEDGMSNIEDRIESIKRKILSASILLEQIKGRELEQFVPDEFSPKLKKDGSPYSANSKIQKEALAAHNEEMRIKEEAWNREQQMIKDRQITESQAIIDGLNANKKALEDELAVRKMSEDEKVAYVKDSLLDIMQAEKEAVQKLRETGLTDDADAREQNLENIRALRESIVELEKDKRQAESLIPVIERINEAMLNVAKFEFLDGMDTSKTERFINGLQKILNLSENISEAKTFSGFFDKDEQEFLTQGYLEAKEAVLKTIGEIEEVEEAYANALQTAAQELAMSFTVSEFKAPEFEAPINPKRNEPYKETSKAYKDAHAQYLANVEEERKKFEEAEKEKFKSFIQSSEDRIKERAKEIKQEKELERAALAEKLARQKTELKEHAKTVQDKLVAEEQARKKVEQDRQKEIAKARQDYKTVLADIYDITKKTDKIQLGGIRTEEDKKALDTYSQHLAIANAKRKELEEKHGQYLTEIADRNERKMLDLKIENVHKVQKAQEAAVKKAQSDYRELLSNIYDVIKQTDKIDASGIEDDETTAAKEKNIAQLDSYNKRRIALEEKYDAFLSEIADKHERRLVDLRIQGLKRTKEEEEKNIRDIQREYKKILSDQLDIKKKLNNIDDSNIGAEGVANRAELERQYLTRDDRRIEIEEEFGDYLVAIQEDANRRILDLETKRIKKRQEEEKKAQEQEWQDYLNSTEGALAFAADAKNEGEMRQAQEYLKNARSNVDADDAATIKAINDEYTRLRINIEKITTAEKNEQSLLPTVANEYKRLLKELDTIQKKKEQLWNTKIEDEDMSAAQESYQALVDRQVDVEAKILQIKEASRGQLAEVERAYAAEVAKDEIDAFTKKEEEKAAIAAKRFKEKMAENSKYGVISTDSANRLMDITSDSANVQNIEQEKRAVEKLVEVRKHLNQNAADYEETLSRLNDEIQEHEDNIKRATDATFRKKEAEMQEREAMTVPEKAIEYSKQEVHSIEDRIKALEYLKEARDKLSSDDFDSEQEYLDKVKELNDEYNRQQQEVDNLRGKQQRLQDSQNGLAQASKQLKQTLTRVFGVQAIINYASKVREVRGEFEMQHKALQVLIQDADAANEIWENTVSLAVKSPYKVDELVRYTKQLSAYKIEASQLYNKTKMLADISSGLGVDMDRIILAYGQVKAANYLRGTELRQFSEAGINVLKELADYYTEIEERAVGVADVFERVSKRMVSFKDVDTVLTKLTSEGGDFYRMQEQQSETLKGLYMNYKDSITLMLNDIGESNEGILKGAISLSKEMVDNWRKLEPIVTALGVAFTTHLTVSGFFKLKDYIQAAIKGMKMLRGATIAATSAQAAMNAINPYAALATAVAGLLALIIRLTKAQSKLNAEFAKIEKDVNKTLAENIKLYQKLATTYNDVTKTTEERTKALKALESKFEDILPEQYLEVQYIEQLTDNYKDAEDAMWSYYNAKALAMKKDKIETTFSQNIETDYEDIRERLTSVIDTLYDGNIKLKAGIDNAIEKAVEGLKDGTIKNNEQARRVLELTLKEFSGVKNFNLGADSIILRNFRQIKNEADRYRERMAGVNGLGFKTYEHQQAAVDKYDIEGKFDELEAFYSKLVSIYRDVAEGKKAITTADDDSQKVLAEAAKKYPEYIDLLTRLNAALNTTARKGAYEFKKSIGGINSSLYLGDGGFVDIVENIPTVESSQAVKDLMSNFAEQLEKEGKSQLNSNMQKAIINAFDYAIESSGNLNRSSIDFFAQLIPDKDTSTTDVKTRIKGIIDSFKELKEEYKTATEAGSEKLPMVQWLDGSEHLARSMDIYLTGSAEMLARNEELLPVLEQVYRLLGGTEKTSDTTDSLFSKKIAVIRELYEAYQDLKKTSTEAQAQEGAWTKVGGAWMEAFGESPKDLGFDNFFSEAGVTEAFGWLINQAKDTGERIQAELANSNFILEGEIRMRVSDQEDFRKEIETMFAQYDITKKMKDMPMLQSVAEQMFDFKPTSLEAIKEKIVGELKVLEAGKGNEDQIKALKEFLDRVNKLEREALEERMNEYVEYARMGLSERAKIKANELRKIKEIEETFKEKEGDSDEVKETKIALKTTAISNVQKETQDALNKLDWEEYTNSDTFVNLLNDLDGASEQLLSSTIKKLKDFRGQWKDMPLEDVKMITDKIADLEVALASLKPFESAKKAREDFNTLYKDFNFENADAKKLQESGKMHDKNAAIQMEVVYQEKALATAERQVGLISTALRIKNGMADADEMLLANEQQYQVLLGKDVNELENQLTVENGKVDKAKQQISAAVQLTSEQKKLVASYKAQEKSIGIVKKQLADVKGAFNSILGALGKSDSSFALFGNMALDMADTVLNTIMLQLQLKAVEVEATAAGVAMNAMAGPLGWILMVIQLIAQVLGAIADYEEEQTNSKIEVLKMSIERLAKAYDKLAKSAEKAWDTALIEAYIKELDSLNQKAIQANQALVASYEGDKKVQKGKKAQEKLDKGVALTSNERAALTSDEYKAYVEAVEALEEQKEKHEDTLKGLVESLGGSFEYADLSEEFLDSWLETFEETGDGLEGLEDSFDEFWKNILKKKVVRDGASVIMKEYLDAVNKALGDGNLSDADIKDLEAKEEAAKKKLDEFYQWANEKYGLAEFGDEADKMSGLQAGIQGITEEQADILASYWNAVRFSTSSIDVKMDTVIKLADGLMSNTSSNPIISNLKEIATNTLNTATAISAIEGYLEDLIQGTGANSCIRTKSV